MGNADLGGDLHLGLALEKAEGDDLFLPVVQFGESLTDGDLVYPVAVVGVVGDLIHNVDGVAAIGKNRLIEGDRVHDGL